MILNWSNVGKGIADIANAVVDNNRLDDLRALGNDYATVSGTGLRVGNDVGVVANGAQGVDENGNPISAEDAYRQAYARAGLTAPDISTEGTKFAARSGQGNDLGVYDTESAADSADRKANYGLTLSRADVYDKYGDENTARALRMYAQQTKRQDAQDEREAALNDLQQRSLKVDVANKETEAAKNQQYQDALTAIGNANYSPEDAAKALIEATRNIYGPEKALDLATKYRADELGQITLNSAKNKASFEDAFSKGPDALAAWYESINGGSRKAKFMPVTGGIALVDYDPNNPKDYKVVARGKDMSDVMTTLGAMATPENMLKLAQVRAEQDKVGVERQKAQAESNYYAAMANRAATYAANSGETLADKRAAVLDKTRDSYVKQLKNLQEQLAVLPTTDKVNRAALTANYNALAKKVSYYDDLIERTLTGGGGGTPDEFEPVYQPGAVITDSAGNKRRFVGGNQRDLKNWELLSGGNGAPASTPTPTSAPKGLSTKPNEWDASKEISVPQYIFTPGPTPHSPETRAPNPEWKDIPKYIFTPGPTPHSPYNRQLNPEWANWQKSLWEKKQSGTR
jgi:hypothetical protein